MTATGPSPSDRGSQFIEAMFRAAKTASAFGLDHDVTQAAARGLTQVVDDLGAPNSVQFVADAAYLDRQLISVPPQEYGKVNTLLRVFENLGFQELSFDKVPAPRDALRLCAVLAEGLVARSRAAEDTAIAGIRWTVVPNASFGGSTESIDTELFAVTHLSLAIADAERAEETFRESQSWRWAAGLSAVRRLERGLATERNAMLRALELSPGPWSAARRAVSVARCVQQALDTVGCPQALVRAAGHAALAAAIVGYVEDLDADAAARRVTPLVTTDISETTPHRLRMATVLGGIAQPSEHELEGIATLVHTAYHLEQLRVRARPGAILTRVDLLALGLKRLKSPWIKLVINMEGLLPPGARVMLADGRSGIVLGAGDPLNPWRPLVLADSDVLVPDRAVRFA